MRTPTKGKEMSEPGDSLLSGYGNIKHEKKSPQQAIRMFCLMCMGGHEESWKDSEGEEIPRDRPYAEVSSCESKTCWLHPYRTGRNPYSARKGNPGALRAHRDSRK